MKVRRIAADGLSAQTWTFDQESRFGEWVLRLSAYGIERRGKPSGPFRKAAPDERWCSSDERRYNSGLNRPTEIPADVIREAVLSVPIAINIGWTNAESTIVTFNHGKGK